MIPFEITILGTSSALPTISRYPTAHVLNVRERFFLIDCGEGTQMQLRKYGIKFTRINHILISHLHGDHYFGLIGLLSTFSLIGRQADLHIYSHSELPELLRPQLDQLMQESSFRIVWHPLNFKKEQIVIDTGYLRVLSFPLKHRIPCCGFLFQEKHEELNIRKEQIAAWQIPLRDIHLIKKGADFTSSEGKVVPNGDLTFPKFKARSYAFCTDTAFIPELQKILQNVDVLYHEATYDKKLEKQAENTFHTTSVQAAELAKLSRAGQLIIGHFSARYKSIDFLVEEAQTVFENTLPACEGMNIAIPQERIQNID
jgi:ribonuclease Z